MQDIIRSLINKEDLSCPKTPSSASKISGLFIKSFILKIQVSYFYLTFLEMVVGSASMTFRVKIMGICIFGILNDTQMQTEKFCFHKRSEEWSCRLLFVSNIKTKNFARALPLSKIHFRWGNLKL